MVCVARFCAVTPTPSILLVSGPSIMQHGLLPRISHIMSLLSLAPDVQEAILFLRRTERGRDPIQMRHLLPIAQVTDWKIQWQLWAALTKHNSA